MSIFGTIVRGIKMPIIRRGDDLVQIAFDSMKEALKSTGDNIQPSDIVAITEAVVSKYEDNFAGLDVIAQDIRQKLGGGTVGVLFPILSRNRFASILKAVSQSSEKVYVQLSYPFDEVGNALMDDDILDDVQDQLDEFLKLGAIPLDKFRQIVGEYTHRFTGLDYGRFYQDVGSNVEVVISNDCRHMLKFTENILIAQIHQRFKTHRRLEKAAPSANLLTLCKILDAPINGSGYNREYGLLGSNLAAGGELKLFPRDSKAFVLNLQKKFITEFGHSPEIMVYGDGAFKDPLCGIWELADPVVSPYYTAGLAGSPNEIKLKHLAETLPAVDAEAKIKEIIAAKAERNDFTDGTTPRRYHDLVGSLCDLTTGSGDKGTPMVWIKGYWSNFAESVT